MSLRIGTRGSALALAQAREVADRLESAGAPVEIVPITTSGDRGAPTSRAGGIKGLFVAEIVRALLDGEVDLAVHSAKDMPAEDPDGLAVIAVPPRADPFDAVVTRDGELRLGASVGSSSLRRRAQLLRWRPDLDVHPLRGNVDTRLRKLDAGEVEALVLAVAGLDRLGIARSHAMTLSIAEMVPAPGQGSLAVQARIDDVVAREIGAAIDDEASRMALAAERGVVAGLGGDCALPLGALATVDDGRVHLVAIVISPDGSEVARTEAEADDPLAAAADATSRLLALGADRILAAVRS